MYEAEVNKSTESIETLPAEIRSRFAECSGRIGARTILPWGEHCTECAWPTCYTTCELYTPREDGACRLFLDGMVRIRSRRSLSPYLLKIQFKRWAKLWTVGNLHLYSLSQAATHEWLNIAVGAASRNMILPASIKPRLLRKISYRRRRAAENAMPSETLPDSFLLECYNPSDRNITLTITMRTSHQAEPNAFHTKVDALPGYTRANVPFSDVSQFLNTAQPFEVEIVPNGCENPVLYFGVMDFVKMRRDITHGGGPAAGTGKFKCIIWDLDNTLWDGILVEDGPEKIRIRPEVVDAIKKTDERGILHSIASKNNYEDAIRILQLNGVNEYFLHPQIDWHPKSRSIAQIIQLLNIGADAVAFVDDQQFEREEVKAVLPQVTVIDAADAANIPDQLQCRVPVTAESKNRRLMYRQEEQRKSAMQSHNGDYLTFLKDCRIELGIRPLNDSNIERVYELAQRTNQLNFSGNRYGRAQLTEILRSPFLETYVIDCTDRFGDYGIVGFGVVDVRQPRLLDLMFSCRVQGKRVEHAVLSFLLRQFKSDKTPVFYANYHKTPRNTPAGKVFEEVGFECLGENEGVLSLEFRYGCEVLDDKIIEVATTDAK